VEPVTAPLVRLDCLRSTGSTVDRGDGSFDYDCDGIETPLIGTGLWRQSEGKGLAGARSTVLDEYGNARLTPGWLTIGLHKPGQSAKYVEGYNRAIDPATFDPLRDCVIKDLIQSGR